MHSWPSVNGVATPPVSSVDLRNLVNRTTCLHRKQGGFHFRLPTTRSVHSTLHWQVSPLASVFPVSEKKLRIFYGPLQFFLSLTGNGNRPSVSHSSVFCASSVTGKLDSICKKPHKFCMAAANVYLLPLPKTTYVCTSPLVTIYLNKKSSPTALFIFHCCYISFAQEVSYTPVVSRVTPNTILVNGDPASWFQAD